MKMQQYLNHPCRLHILFEGKNLFYHAKKVTEVTENHITFIDRFNNTYTFRLADIKEASRCV